MLFTGPSAHQLVHVEQAFHFHIPYKSKSISRENSDEFLTITTVILDA